MAKYMFVFNTGPSKKSISFFMSYEKASSSTFWAYFVDEWDVHGNLSTFWAVFVDELDADGGDGPRRREIPRSREAGGARRRQVIAQR